MSRKGLIIVVSAPSGAGKSTLCLRLLKKVPRLRYSISYTTRPPRPGEKNGKDYFFVSERSFRDMVRRRAFVEWACVHDHFYGTPKEFLDKMVRTGNDVILDIDVQGGEKIRRAYPDAVMIFVMAPSMQVLERRLRARKKDSEEVIGRRLLNARKELNYLPKYTYLVINDVLSDAADEIESVISAEHLRINRQKVSKF